MKIPLPWRRKQSSLARPPSLRSLQNIPPPSSPQPQPATSPRSLNPAFPLRTSPRQQRPQPADATPSLYHPILGESTATDTTDYPDLYSSTANVEVEDEGSETEFLPDQFLEGGLVPCSPRWLADHADASIRHYRSAAQMGAIAEMATFYRPAARPS